MPQQSDVYLGNPNLKKANTDIQFTEDNVKEFLKCKDDPVYFARKYIMDLKNNFGPKIILPQKFLV